MNYLPELLTIASIHLLALMSPGPDFLIVIKHSLGVSRKAGVYTAFGLALGMPLHITYSLLGIGYIIANSIVVFSTIKFLGAAYLIYIGIKALRSKPSAEQELSTEDGLTKVSSLKAIQIGFLTNALNPKVTLFFLALFTQVISPTTPLGMQILYGVEMTLATFAWFSLVALLLSHGRIQKRFLRIRHHLDRTFGALLIALGIKVALSSKN